MREALPLPADALDRRVTVLVDLEDERLREFRPDVEGRARHKGSLVIPLPDAAPERHLRGRLQTRSNGGLDGRQGLGQALSTGPPALGHFGPSATLALDTANNSLDERSG